MKESNAPWRHKTWQVIDSDHSWQLFEWNDALGGNQHPLQLIKAPKKSIEYAEYWPDEKRTALIEAAPDMFVALEQFLIDMLNTWEGDPKDWHPNARDLFFEGRAAYHKALGKARDA